MRMGIKYLTSKPISSEINISHSCSPVFSYWKGFLYQFQFRILRDNKGGNTDLTGEIRESWKKVLIPTLPLLNLHFCNKSLLSPFVGSCCHTSFSSTQTPCPRLRDFPAHTFSFAVRRGSAQHVVQVLLQPAVLSLHFPDVPGEPQHCSIQGLQPFLGVSALCTWKREQNQKVNLKAENKELALKRVEQLHYSSQMAELTASVPP